MGIALLSLSNFIQSFVPSATRRLNSARPLPRPVTYVRPVWANRRPVCTTVGQKNLASPHATYASHSAHAVPSARRHHGAASTLPLRVLRVSESDQRIRGAGRMVISGRMADLCAELDRLAAIEAAQG